MLGTCTSSGDIDRATAATFGAQIYDTIDNSDEALVSVDCSGVTFMDSVGLHALLEARYDRERTGGSLRIVAASATVRRLFELVGLTELLDPA